MSNGFGFWIEGVVAMLLLLTIVTCIVLDRRLKRFKADEQALKATISELMTATEIAERAIAGLKLTVQDCDEELSERLRSAERFSAEIADQIAAGESVLERLTRIVTAAGGGRRNGIAPLSDTESIVAAAQAFADRTRGRMKSIAA
jgi:chromosome segregation ATPase